MICKYTFFSYKNMISRSEPQKEIEIATNKIKIILANLSLDVLINMVLIRKKSVVADAHDVLRRAR